MTAVTEKEAETKWCPFGRIAHVNGSTCNSPAHNDPDLMQTCIGSRCMAWRWIENPHETVPDNYGGVRFGNGTGYCALAGRQE